MSDAVVASGGYLSDRSPDFSGSHIALSYLCRFGRHWCHRACSPPARSTGRHTSQTRKEARCRRRRPGQSNYARIEHLPHSVGGARTRHQKPNNSDTTGAKLRPIDAQCNRHEDFIDLGRRCNASRINTQRQAANMGRLARGSGSTCETSENWVFDSRPVHDRACYCALRPTRAGVRWQLATWPAWRSSLVTQMKPEPPAPYSVKHRPARVTAIRASRKLLRTPIPSFSIQHWLTFKC